MTQENYYTPKDYYELALQTHSRSKCEHIIAQSSEYAYRYARNFLKAPFPLGEKAISENPDYSRCYARFVLNSRFPLGEPAILKDSLQSRYYAQSLNEQDPQKYKDTIAQLESTIAQSAQESFYYAESKGERFLLGEPAILQSSLAEEYTFCYREDFDPIFVKISKIKNETHDQNIITQLDELIQMLKNKE